ncbi:MAG: hypothetical protein JNN07_12615 [Verrucomicrobiales bacterium]|jgi:hypothetical protein|nr:hypothetical protein [Verrucomicrobiales bacterium]
MTTQQIELSFVNTQPGARAVRYERRRNRAQWWFRQMRLAVDRAMDWKPVPQARPEQIYMPLTGGQL